jgi:hypothetical protein
MSRRNRNRTISYTLNETFHGHELETECTVEFEVEPGEPTVMWGDNAHPGSDPSVLIYKVTVDDTGEIVTDYDADAVSEHILDLMAAHAEEDA